MRLALAASVVAALAFAACGGSKEKTPEEAAAAAASHGIANAMCPVMGNPVDVEDPDLFVDYKGQKIGFCCAPCKPKFLKDPEKYMEGMRKDPKKYGYKP